MQPIPPDDTPAVTGQDASPQPIPAAAGGPRFSLLVSIVAAIILVGGIGAFVWLQVSIPRLERIAFPERALTLMVGRMMDLEEAVTQAPRLEQDLYEMTSGGRAYELAQALEWFEELAPLSANPVLALQLAILEGEAGRVDQLRMTVAEWERRAEPYSLYARFVAAAYLTKALSRDAEGHLQAELAEALPGGWFYDRLAINLARRAGDEGFASVTEQAMFARGSPLLNRSRVFGVIEFLMIAAGLAVLAAGRRAARQVDERVGRIGPADIPPPWRGRTGIAVLLRGGALGVAVMWGMLSLGSDDPLIRLAMIPLTNIPLLILAHHYLFRPAGRTFSEGVGLGVCRGAILRYLLTVPVIMAVGLLGEWGIQRVAVSLEQASHWTEWFDPDLVWGSLPMLSLSLTEYVLLAPMFEEVVFRGLIYSTLRRRFSCGTSALVSAAIFAMAHGYGPIGFASVLWSGLVWAVAYEKTGSLLPGMTAHALNNLIVCLTLLALLSG